MTDVALPLLLLRKLDQRGMTLKQACESPSEDLHVLNPSRAPLRVRFSGRYWQTVNEDTGTSVTHGPPMAEFSIVPGQMTWAGNIVGWEWDSVLDAELAIIHEDGTTTVLFYDLKRNWTKITVKDLGTVFLVDPINHLPSAAGMSALGRWLLESEDRDSRLNGVAWITRAAELGYAEAQIRLAEMMTREDAWSQYGLGHDQDEAAWWLATARDHAKSPAGIEAAETMAERHKLTLPPVSRNPIRRMTEKGWSVVSTLLSSSSPLLPVAELRFSDLPRIGPAAMVTLLRHSNPPDWAWALAPNGNDVSSRLRHFVLGCMEEQSARLLMRNMLAADVERNRLQAMDAMSPILNVLCDLCDDSFVTLPEDLAAELWQRQSSVSMPSDGSLYDFSGNRKNFAAAHDRMARRPTRDQPLAVRDAPPPGWYADTLGQQPNATIRAVLSRTGERPLCCYLSGCPSFTRFRFWQVSSSLVRERLIEANQGYGIGESDRAKGWTEMGACLRIWHQEGRLEWWG